MNVLAHRNISQMDVRGTVEVNDRPIGRKINAMSAYIQQEDLFVGSLTVRKHLTFQVNDVTFSFLRMMYYSLSDTSRHRQTRKREIRVLLLEVESKTFRLLFRILYH